MSHFPGPEGGGVYYLEIVAPGASGDVNWGSVITFATLLGQLARSTIQAYEGKVVVWRGAATHL